MIIIRHLQHFTATNTSNGFLTLTVLSCQMLPNGVVFYNATNGRYYPDLGAFANNG